MDDLNNYYKLPDGRYISYYELANNPKYSTQQEDTWYEVDIPENFLDMELLYKKGGKLIKRFK